MLKQLSQEKKATVYYTYNTLYVITYKLQCTMCIIQKSIIIPVGILAIGTPPQGMRGGGQHV